MANTINPESLARVIRRRVLIDRTHQRPAGCRHDELAHRILFTIFTTKFRHLDELKRRHDGGVSYYVGDLEGALVLVHEQVIAICNPR